MKSDRAIKPIRNERDHEAALAEIARLMETDLDEAGEDRLDVLTTLAEAWEREHHALGLPADPIEALKAHMDQTGRTQADLAEVLDSRSRASELLNRRTALSITMIRTLRDAWGLPVAVLVGDASMAGEKLVRYRVRSRPAAQRRSPKVKKRGRRKSSR